MHKLALGLMAFFLGSQAALAAVQGKEISYTANGVTMKGYLAYDDAIQGKRPGVLVVHEWWGHNEYARQRARMLAEMGYTALAVDMYGDGKTADHPKDAGAFAGEVRKNADLAKARFQAALETLQKDPTVQPRKIAALGYCFGGSVVLDMARQGLPLRAVASYHGGLSTDVSAKKGRFRGEIMVFTGAEDPMIPPAQVDAFKQEMDKARISYKVVSYPGVKHSFTNPDADALGKKFELPLAYDAKADEDSWTQTKAFLETSLSKKRKNMERSERGNRQRDAEGGKSERMKPAGDMKSDSSVRPLMGPQQAPARP